MYFPNVIQRFLLSCIFVFCFALASLAESFEFNDNCRKAYNAIVSLHLAEGEQLLAQEQKKNPDNLIAVYLENYIDFLKIYTSDSRNLYNKLQGNKDLRIEMLKAGDSNSPWYLYTAAEVNIQWATMSIRFGDYLNAIVEIRKAYKFLEENTQRFPQFKANKKSLGVLYALLGSVPDKYKWGVSLLGMQGNVGQGLNDLKELIAYSKTNDYIFREETVIMYSFLVFHLQNDAEKAWQILKENGFPGKDNLMNVFACAHIGVYGKHNEEALKILESNSVSFGSFPLLTYLQGLATLNSLSTNADAAFKKFLAEYKGENHIKSAWQKIAWSALLRGDTAGYRTNMARVLKTGTDLIEADKQAQKEAESRQVPNIVLLKARLLFDGGYYEKAATEMNRLNEKSFKTEESATEYLYRLGRIYDAWGKPDIALTYYAKTIDKGKNLPRYFAANAALESARIYEERGDKEKAKSLYNLCLTFEDHEYKNGIDQKAKAGLNRLN